MFVSSPDIREEILDTIRSLAISLMKNGDLIDFYYNLYNIPPRVPTQVRFGFYRLRDKTMIRKKFDELKNQGMITKVETLEPDLGDADGVAIDKIKLTARKITELIKKDFQGSISVKQAHYLIHLSMNPLFGYVDERKIYLGLTKAIEKAIRENNILPKEQWLSFLNVT